MMIHLISHWGPVPLHCMQQVHIHIGVPVQARWVLKLWKTMQRFKFIN